MHSATVHAISGGQNTTVTGSSTIKKVVINTPRETCPDGKLNLSGPKHSGSSFIAGRRRRVAALITATITMSVSRPMNRFTCIWYHSGLSIIQQNASHPASQAIPWHEYSSTLQCVRRERSGTKFSIKLTNCFVITTSHSSSFFRAGGIFLPSSRRVLESTCW
uniref:Uncharacterized protein n=1 Tax=Anopheles merus TaxID=30066 RepID=A0A182V1X6_ANOME